MFSKVIEVILKKFGSKDNSFNSIFKNTSTAFIIKLLNAVAGFAYNVLLAKQIGAEGAGVYYLAFSVNSIAILISELGFRNVLLRFVASTSGENNWSETKGVIAKTFLISGLLGLLAFILIYLNAEFIAITFFQDTSITEAVKIMSIGILPMTFILLCSAILKGLTKFKEGLIIGGLMVPLIGIPLMFLLTKWYGVIGAVYSLVIVNIITLILGLFWCFKYLPQLRTVKASFSTALIFSTGFPLFIIAFTNFVMAGGDVLFLGYWEDNNEVGIYGLAKRIAALTAFILVAINSIVAPKFARLYKQGKMNELKNVAQNSVKLLLLFAIPAVLVLTLFSDLIMELVGKDFSTGGQILIILALGQFINVITGSVGYLLMMCGFEKAMTINIVVVALFTALLYYFLIPSLGITGAAIASATGLALQNIIAFILVKIHLGFWVIPKFKFSN